MIWTTLSDLCSVQLFVQSWVNCTTMNNLYYVEWFSESWISATLNDLNSVERFVLRWMIRSAMDDLYNVESFGQDELLSFSFLMSARCTYSRKYCQIFYTYPELIFSWFWHIQQLLEQIWRSTFLHDVTMLHNCVKYLLINKWKSYFHLQEMFKALTWLMPEYVRTIVAGFFFKAHSPVVEMILFWK